MVSNEITQLFCEKKYKAIYLLKELFMHVNMLYEIIEHSLHVYILYFLRQNIACTLLKKKNHKRSTLSSLS